MYFKNINICTIRMAGMPITNLLCLVLCLNKRMPVNIPSAPKAIAIVNKVFSGVLHFPVRDFFLSEYITKIPYRFIAKK